jgi:serine/threonine protein kinase
MSEDKTLVTLNRQCPNCRGMYANSIAVCPTDGMLLMPVQADANIGTLFADKYRIIEELGRGGMSIVYKGAHEIMKRPVAVKLMQRELSSNPISVRRFQQEAEAAGSLSHPHVITIFDFGVTATAQPYLIMDLVRGTTLSEELKSIGKLPPARALKIFCQICEALEHAHQRGVVHRDLKPSNVMLVPHESDVDYVKVLDFGIAKIMSSDGEKGSNLTTSGEIFGSPLYMSPEQCKGSDIDYRTDIYSVGVMLYEMLTGKPPISGLTYIETIQMQISTPPRPFNSVSPDAKIPSVLESIVFKAMAKKREERYQSMKDFHEALIAASRMLGITNDATMVPPLQGERKKSMATTAAVVIGIACLIAVCALLVTESTKNGAPGMSAASFPSERVDGTIYYYNPDGHPGVLVVNTGEESKTILLGESRLEHVHNAPADKIWNGGKWNVAFQHVGQHLVFDEKGTTFSGTVDPDVRAVDELIRNHYSNLANGHLEQAFADFSDAYIQKLKSKAQVIESWKHWNGVKGCENAPDSAIKVYQKVENNIFALVDGSKFVLHEKNDYQMTFWKDGQTWKIQSLSLKSKDAPGTL